MAIFVNIVSVARQDLFSQVHGKITWIPSFSVKTEFPNDCSSHTSLAWSDTINPSGNQLALDLWNVKVTFSE